MMLYTGRNETPRVGEPPRVEERRTFTRRIDCEETRRPRASDGPAGPLNDARVAPGRRAYDID